MLRRTLLVVVTLLALNGCYYTQALRGQLEVMRKREPIAEVLHDPATSEALAHKLRLVQQARAFSVQELGLPDNGSYRSYADLERNYVVWNIFAAPELALDAKQWCYPIAGCVSYRGYFREATAKREAAKLQRQGYDVFVGGVAAYSTLGRFDDPVLNTMLQWDDVRLVSVVFHELAHQLLYIKDDTEFNESFASAVEEFGVERFLRAQAEDRERLGRHRQQKALQCELGVLIRTAREDLQTYYSETIDDDEKRLLKEHRLERLASEIHTLLVNRGRDPSGWQAASLNNARLLSVSLYEGRLPAFRAMLEACDDGLRCFYAEATRVSALDRTRRDAYLDTLATRSAACRGPTATSSSLSRRESPVSRQ